jgi:hypothetical protein
MQGWRSGGIWIELSIATSGVARVTKEITLVIILAPMPQEGMIGRMSF